MSEPVTVAELRTHLRLTSTTEDTYLGSLIAAAREMVEHETDRTLVPKVITLRLDDFPTSRDWFELPAPPARAVVAITYLDPDGDSATMAAADYSVHTACEPARVHLAVDADWPSTQESAGCVTVTYTAGYADPLLVPPHARQAVLWLAAWWYEQRVPVNVGNIVNELPHHLRAVFASMQTFLIHRAAITSIAAAETTTGDGSMRVYNLPSITALTGGGTTALDGLSTSIYQAGDIVITTIGDDAAQWLLRARAEGESEDGVGYIQPDDSSTLIWVLVD